MTVSIEVDHAARDFVEKYNQHLPAQIAPNGRQEKSSYSDGVITHNYTFPHKPGAQLIAEGLQGRIQSNLIQEHCTDPYTKNMINKGLKFRHRYFGNDGVLGAEVTITARDCT